MAKPCIECGAVSQGTRCPSCEQQRQSKRNARRIHYHGGWEAKSRDARAAWVAEHGWVCPGVGRPPHPTHALTLDHTTGQVLCQRCNVQAGPAHH